MMSSKKPTKDELAEEVRRLEEEVRELRKASSEPPTRKEGVAEGVVADLGGMIPGLQKLINVASEMPEFRQRLAAIDEDIKRKFKEKPLRRALGEMTKSIGHRSMGIPPGVRRGRPGHPTSTGTGSARFSQKPPGRGKSGPPIVHISPETPDQLPVDVFDEEDKLVVLAEATGLKLCHITVALEGAVLVISIDGPQGKSVQRVELPCEVVGEPKTSLAKGILKIQMTKADK